MKFGTLKYNALGDIVGIHGMDLRVENLPEHKGELKDYWLAWVDENQGDGETRNEAIRAAQNSSSAK